MWLMRRKSAETPIRKYYPLKDSIVKNELPIDCKAFEKRKVYHRISKSYKAAGMITFCEFILLFKHREKCCSIGLPQMICVRM